MFYLLTEVGDSFDPLRKGIAEILQASSKIKSIVIFRQALEEKGVKITTNDEELKEKFIKVTNSLLLRCLFHHFANFVEMKAYGHSLKSECH